MADEPKVVPPVVDATDILNDNAEAADKYTASTDKATSSVDKLSAAQLKLKEISEKEKAVQDNVTSGVISFIKNIKEGTALTDGQSAALGKLTSQLSTSSQAFSKLSNQEISTKFVDQYAKVSDLILKEIAPVLGKGTDAINAVTQKLLGIKLPTQLLDKPIQHINTYIMKQFAAADAANRLRDSILSNAVSTGRYGDVLRSSGDKLEFLNNLVENHNELIINASEATGMTTKQIQSYYDELNKIPGAFDNVVNSEKGFNISMLAATATLSSATRLSSSEITKLMKKAYDEYGVSDERALQFVARMSEASNNLKLPFENVKSYMEGVASETGMLGKNIDSAARILNEYSSSFTRLGLSAGQATKLISGMTSQVTSMNIAQKAFLSSQSGGPGRLMGAFKIDKLIKDGKLDEVMKMAENQMKRQFGKIVTLEEASNSPQAAAQLAKQTTMLKSGPLGQFAKTDQEAYKILEALKSKDTSVLKDSIKQTQPSSMPVQDFLKVGNSLQEKSLTMFSRMANGIDALVQRGALSTREEVETTYAAGVPSKSSAAGTPDLNSGMRNELKNNKLGSERHSELLSTVMKDGFNSSFKSNQNAESARQYAALGNNIKTMGKEFVTSRVNTAKMTFGNGYADREEEALADKYANPSKTPLNTEDIIKQRIKPREVPSLPAFEQPRIAMSRDVSSVTKKADADRKEAGEKQEVDVKVGVDIKGLCINCGKEMDKSTSAISTTGINAGGK